MLATLSLSLSLSLKSQRQSKTYVFALSTAGIFSEDGSELGPPST